MEDTNKALNAINIIVEGLSITDPSRKVFLDFKKLFEKDFNMGVASLSSFSTDDLTRLIRKNLATEEVVWAFEALTKTILEYKGLIMNLENKEVDEDGVSVLISDVSYDINIVEKAMEDTIRVSTGKDVDIDLYYSIGNRVNPIIKSRNESKGLVEIASSYTIDLSSYSSAAKKKTHISNFLNNKNGSTIDKDQLATITGKSAYIRIKESSYIDIDNIVSAIVVKDSPSGVLLSINKVIAAPSSKEPVNNSFMLLTDDIKLKDTAYYRVVGKETVVSGKYKYSPDCGGKLVLQQTIDGETVEEKNENVIRLNYHIFGNKVDAVNMSINFDTYLKDLEVRNDDLIAKEKKLEGESRKLEEKSNKSRHEKINADAKKSVAEAEKKLAEAKKVGKETAILESEETIAKAKADISDEQVGAELAEAHMKKLKLIRETDKADSEKNMLDMKTIAIAIGAGVVGYSLYQTIRADSVKGVMKLSKFSRYIL